MNQEGKVRILLEKYFSDTLCISERKELYELMLSGQYDHLLSQLIEDDIDKIFQADRQIWVRNRTKEQLYVAEQDANRLSPRRKLISAFKWAAAAIFVGLLFTAGIMFFNSTAVDNTYALEKKGLYKNDSKQIITVKLSDGTTVDLYPGAEIFSITNFSRKTREVQLEGNAFFNVAKDATKPFIVYSGDIRTTVIGTSFLIKKTAVQGDIEVEVVTGKVQVVKMTAGRARNAVLLTSNQKAVYDKKKNALDATIVQHPVLITSSHDQQGAASSTDAASVTRTFIYTDALLQDVLNDISKAYGLDVIISGNDIKSRKFTGDISSQDLFTQLKIIGLATNTHYEIEQTKILIKEK